MRTNGQIKIARPSRLPLKQWMVGRQSRKRKFPSRLCAFTGSELALARAAPPTPGPAWSCPRPLLAPSQALCRDPQALLHTWELQRQLSCLRGWPRGRGSLCVWATPCWGCREAEARPFPCLSSLRRRPSVPGETPRASVPVPSFLLSPPLRPSLSPVTQGGRLGKLGLLQPRGS